LRSVDMFTFGKQVLENFFPKYWFTKIENKNHEAFQQWNLCCKLIARGGIIEYPEQANEFPAIGKILLDTLLLSTITDGDMKDLVVGAINYGGKKVQKKIQQRFLDSQQFQDILVELYLGAWHITKKNIVTPLETNGYPDIKVEFPNMHEYAYIECKHLRTNDERRINDVIAKANKQIENANTDGYGGLTLDVSIPVNAGTVKDDTLPPQLTKIIDIVQSALSGQENRAVDSALVVWDDNMIIGVPPQKVGVTYRRRYVRVNHTNSKKPIPANVLLFEGFTVYFSIKWTARPKQPQSYNISIKW
jgi:hypothetical protein